MPRFCRETRKMWPGAPKLRISSILPAEEVPRDRWWWMPRQGGSELVKAIRLIIALRALALAAAHLHAPQAPAPGPLPAAKPELIKPAKSKTNQSKAAQSKPAEKHAQ